MPTQSRRRAGQHDRPTVALFDHHRYRDIDCVVYAGEIDVDDVAPALHPTASGDAGVGDDDVQPPELVQPCLQRGAQRIPIANVGLSRHNPRIPCFDELTVSARSSGVAYRVGNRRDRRRCRRR
jgi:hypothetical protein